MIYPECLQAVAIQLKCLLRALDFFIYNRKRQLRSNYPQTAYHPFQSLWTDHSQRLPPIRVPHCKQKAGKAADMVAMIMSKADHVNRLKTPSFFFHRNLGSFPAVNKQAAAVKPGQQSRQIAVRQRHHPPASQQTNI